MRTTTRIGEKRVSQNDGLWNGGVRSAARHKTALASTAVKRRTALISFGLLEAVRDVAKARALSLRMLGSSVIDYVTEAARGLISRLCPWEPSPWPYGQ